MLDDFKQQLIFDTKHLSDSDSPSARAPYVVFIDILD